MGFLFQNYALFPHLTVSQNILFSMDRLPKHERLRRAKEIIKKVCLKGLEHRYPYQLSGGQQQRAALARALAMEPEILLLDEPFSALDNHLRNQMEKELIDILADYKGVTLFVTHNLEESYRICNNLMILNNGRIVSHDEKDTLFNKPSTFTTAILTDCQNISRASTVSDYRVDATDWGITLDVTGPVPHGLTHIGIRAHHLSFVDDSDMVNAFHCWLTKTIETPHRMTLYVRLSPPSKTSDHTHLQIEVSKEVWHLMKDRPLPWLLHLNPEHLFLTNGL